MYKYIYIHNYIYIALVVAVWEFVLWSWLESLNQTLWGMEIAMLDFDVDLDVQIMAKSGFSQLMFRPFTVEYHFHTGTILVYVEMKGFRTDMYSLPKLGSHTFEDHITTTSP